MFGMNEGRVILFPVWLGGGGAQQYGSVESDGLQEDVHRSQGVQSSVECDGRREM